MGRKNKIDEIAAAYPKAWKYLESLKPISISLLDNEVALNFSDGRTRQFYSFELLELFETGFGKHSFKWNKNELPEGKHDGSVWPKAYSDEVIGIDDEGLPHRVFYDHQYKNWNHFDTQAPVSENIVYWQELPEEFRS